jgi:hypothetical protein
VVFQLPSIDTVDAEVTRYGRRNTARIFLTLAGGDKEAVSNRALRVVNPTNVHPLQSDSCQMTYKTTRLKNTPCL